MAGRRAGAAAAARAHGERCAVPGKVDQHCGAGQISCVCALGEQHVDLNHCARLTVADEALSKDLDAVTDCSLRSAARSLHAAERSRTPWWVLRPRRHGGDLNRANLGAGMADHASNERRGCTGTAASTAFWGFRSLMAVQDFSIQTVPNSSRPIPLHPPSSFQNQNSILGGPVRAPVQVIALIFRELASLASETTEFNERAVIAVHRVSALRPEILS